jgi:hypothetical protein
MGPLDRSLGITDLQVVCGQWLASFCGWLCQWRKYLVSTSWKAGGLQSTFGFSGQRKSLNPCQ